MHRARFSRVLTTPLWWGALALLVLNDHVLKGAGLLPSSWTGKLSDLAGMIVAPPLLAVVAGARSRRGWLAAHLAIAVGFAAIKLSPAAAAAVVDLVATVGLSWRIWPDPTDLLALPALWISWRGFSDAAARDDAASATRWYRARTAAALVLGVLATCATSQLRAPQPAAAPDRVLAQSWTGNPVYVLDGSSGRTIRAVDVSGNADEPLVAGGTLFTSDEGEIFAYELTTGVLQWRLPRPDDGYLERPLAADEENVYVHFLPGTTGSGVDWEQRHLFAIDRKTGRQRWHVPTTSSASRPALEGGTVVASAGDELIAVNKKTGKVTWRFAAKAALCTPIVWRAHVYVGDAEGVLYAVDLASGKLAWSHPTGTKSAFSEQYYRNDPPVSVSEGLLFYVAEGTLYAMDPDTRKPRWKIPEVIGVTAAAGIVLARDDGSTFTAFEAASGRKLWRAAIHDAVYTRPLIHDGFVYVRPQSQVLYAFDLATGKLQWTFDLAGGAVLGPVGAGAIVVRPGRDL